MDFGLADHQQQLREVARAFLADRLGPDELRDLEAGELGYAPELHREMGKLGWHELAADTAQQAAGDHDPVEDGPGLLDLVLLYEEFGRAAAPGPHFTATLLAAPLLAGSPTPAHRAVRDAVATGDRVVAVAVDEQAAGYDPTAVQLVATRTGDAVTLTGHKMFVPYAAGADDLLVLCRTGSAAADLTWVLVPAGTPGLRITALHTLSNDKHHRLDLKRVTVGADAVVGDWGGGWSALRALRPRATVVQAAELLGLAQAAFEAAVAYARTRVAFGRPIGSFQAVAHMCADMYADCDAIRFLVYQATCLIEAGRAEAPEVAMAKAFAAAAARRVTKSAHQIYGGHGFVRENPLHFYYRRQKTIELALGDAGEQLDAVAAGLLAG